MGRKLILGIACVVIAAVVLLAVIVVVNNNANNSASSNNGNNNPPPVHIPMADIQIVTKDCEKTLGGDAKFTIKVTNVGDAIGTKTYTCRVNIGENTFRETLTITLAPAETKTYTVTVDLPIGNLLSSWTWNVSANT